MDIIKLFPGGFPLTIERLQFLQDSYGKAISQLTKIAGTGNMIIEGVVNEAGNVTAGVVVIDGEIMEFRAGAFASTVSIYEEVVNVPYNEDADQDGNLDQKAADTVRFAACGTGGVASVTFSSFTRIASILQTMPQVGDIKMIYRAFNATLDAGWALCDGTNGTPNMVDRFPMGAGTLPVATIGGANEVVLTAAQMPNHNHNGNATLPAHSHSLGGKTAITYDGEGGDGNRLTNKDNIGSGTVTQTSNSPALPFSFNTNFKGSDQAHENRPKFVTFNYLMFVGF